MKKNTCFAELQKWIVQVRPAAEGCKWEISGGDVAPVLHKGAQRTGRPACQQSQDNMLKSLWYHNWYSAIIDPKQTNISHNKS